ncbi:MAG: hypothetical protein ACK4QW_13655 [Alphaproteobacteria bacterium]
MIDRGETPGDVAAVRALHLACFPGPEEADLVDRLRHDGDAAIALVAVDAADAIVGHVLFSPMRARSSPSRSRRSRCWRPGDGAVLPGP